ncbi:hypothetical protein EYC84_005872 [Monilinia fructicola]|uniref:rRNA methyltransferase 1, mitochondrial n=1 Tax=Monilinia fructicola TaxID=38448 RepID=A0A5M9K2P4_MONFR|nr:hypothetical protein EYC84_005872 [Monilinia fructicola]
MSTILLTGAKAAKRVSFILQPLYSSSCSVRYASINSGINRGLRKSKGVGFRTKDKGRPSRGHDSGGRGFQVPGLKPHARERQDRGSADDYGGRDKSMHSRFKGNGRDDQSKSKYRNPSPFGDRRDKDVFKNHLTGTRSHEIADQATGKKSNEYGAQDETFGNEKKSSSKSYGFLESYLGSDKKSFKKSFEPRDNGSHFEQQSYPNLEEASKLFGVDLKDVLKKKKGHKYISKYPTREERLAVKHARAAMTSKHFGSPPDSAAPSQKTPEPAVEVLPRKVTPSFAKKMPITIPYTTPASEFLYGTSVVEAALSARPRRGRKLYKLYIHKSEERQNGERDGILARLARKKGVQVVEVKGHDWLRTLDKMSQGRPHNGYILEASPLPRLPVVSLGEVIDQGNSSAIKLTLDHQSREETEINGTDTIIKVPKDSTGRNPLILLLDSIEDPQNLGALLRTAAFMGVTAVAISTRNSASFTPVVFKASAGAAETIELFSINKPSGFIKESQSAGWKIYAAVAPPAPRKADSRYMWPITSKQCIWAHDLQDPLRADPCILMVGGEGEGLRKNLKDLADVHISIKGGARTMGKLDSLNVSVATGILCDAFMRQTTQKTVEDAVKKVEEAVRKVEEETEKLDHNQIF